MDICVHAIAVTDSYTSFSDTNRQIVYRCVNNTALYCKCLITVTTICTVDSTTLCVCCKLFVDVCVNDILV
jgi:hypothetical protein